MGAHDYIITCQEADQAKVRKLWDRQVEEDSYESGSGAYAGNATTMHGRITFYDRRLASEDEARRFVLDKHQKWSGPVACSYYLPAKKGEREKKRETKAVERYDALWEKAKAVIVKANASFRERKSKMIGCPGCGSRLAKDAYLQNTTIFSVLHNRYGNWLNTFACPVCKEALVSKTVLARAKAYEPKLAAAIEGINEACKPKPSKKIAWAVGGWAAS